MARRVFCFAGGFTFSLVTRVSAVASGNIPKGRGACSASKFTVYHTQYAACVLRVRRLSDNTRSDASDTVVYRRRRDAYRRRRVITVPRDVGFNNNQSNGPRRHAGIADVLYGGLLEMVFFFFLTVFSVFFSFSFYDTRTVITSARFRKTRLSFFHAYTPRSGAVENESPVARVRLAARITCTPPVSGLKVETFAMPLLRSVINGARE